MTGLRRGRTPDGRLPDLVRRPWLPLAVALALLAVPLIGMPTRAIADRIALGPVVLAHPGQHQTIVRSVRAPTVPGRLDLMAVLDLTGSYTHDLPKTVHLLPALRDQLTRRSDLRTGVATFMDAPPPACCGEPGDYVYRLDVPLTSNPVALADGLAALRIGNGGDIPEAWLTALDQLTTDAGWRNNASRVEILATDADSHYTGDGTAAVGPTLEEVTAKLLAAGIRVVALLPHNHNAPMAAEVAKLTGGSVQYVDHGSGNLGQAVLAGLRALPTDVRPAFRGDCPIDGAQFDPPVRSGVTAGTRVPFHLTYQVAPGTRPGAYTCTVDFGEAGASTFRLVVHR